MTRPPGSSTAWDLDRIVLVYYCSHTEQRPIVVHPPRLVPPAIRALVRPSGGWPLRHETRRVRRDQPGFGCLERVGARRVRSGGARTGRRTASSTAADPPVRIPVFDNQIEPALKTLKREMLKDGLFKEMKLRAFYEKPSVKRKRKQAAARRKRRKAQARLERSSVD